MNYKMIKFTLGWLLIFESAFFLLPLVTGIVYGERITFDGTAMGREKNLIVFLPI